MKTVSLGSTKLRVLDTGSGGGIPILFVHGFPLDHSMWEKQLGFFSERCRVIVPDLRGFGGSDVTPGTVTMEQYADDLNALLEELGVQEKIIFCGLSMGGYIGWQFYKKYAHRLRGLVMADTRAAADTPEAGANRLKLAERVEREGMACVADVMMPKLFSPVSVTEQEAVLKQIHNVIMSSNPQGIAAALRGMAAREDFTAQLPKVDVPTLIVVGEHDAIAPVEEMRGIADELEDSVWVMIPNAGHMSPLENPAVFNEALEEFIEL